MTEQDRWSGYANRLCVKNKEGMFDRVRKHQLKRRHVGYYDDHRNVWVPLEGGLDIIKALLGDAWEFDSYYGAFFWDVANVGREPDITDKAK